ncbi:MAG TPA: T9SS type A sorting domain-containing protein [Bacteroidia bacterium]|nr:T9SS type A sorting domain-containing protein [Bacteroidia bacterium]
MNKIYSILSLSILLIAGIIFTHNNASKPQNLSKKIGAGSIYSSEGRAEWETLRLSDPETGTIPAGMRAKELRFASTLPQYNSSSFARVGAAFFQRGPFNVGGRTRSIAVDVTNENIFFAGSVNGGLWRSVDAGMNWTLVSSLNQNPAITSITQDKRPGHTNTWYYTTGEGIGTSASGAGAFYLGNGVFKSVDGGLTWNLLPATSTGTPHSFDAVFDITYKIVTDQSNLVNDVVYLATYGAIFRSSNGGSTWQLEKGGVSPYSYTADVDVTTTGVVYATLDSDGSQKGIWRKDPTLGWASITPPGWDTSTIGRVVIGINPSNENQVYFLGETPNTGRMTVNWKGDQEWNSLWKYTYLSGNGTGVGGNWTDLSANIPFLGTQLGNFNSQGGYDLLVKVHPTDTNVVIIGGTNLFRSASGFTDSLSTTSIGGYDPVGTIPFYDNYPNHHPDQHDLVFLPSTPDRVYQSNDGGIFFTNDIKATPVVWQELNNGYTTSQFYTVALDHAGSNDIIVGGTQDNGTWFTNSANPLVPWVNPGLGDGSHCAIDDGHQNYYMSRQEGRIGKFSLDASGNILGLRRIDPIGGSDYLFINPFILDPNNTNRMYLGAGNKIWRNDSLSSIPLTGEWDTISTGWFVFPDSVLTAGAKVSCLAVSPTAPHRLYVGTSKRSIYRVDNPESSSPVMTEISSNSFNANSYVSCVAVDPNDADKLIAVFSNYEIYSMYYTVDGGTVWTKIGGNLEANSAGTGNGPSIRWATIAATATGNVYLVGTSIGLFATNNLNGLSTVWTHLAPNEIGNIVVDMMDYRSIDGLLAIATHGAGMFSTTISDTLFTKILPVPILNSSVEVFPNPVREEFILRFEVKKATKINISLYDTQGKRAINLGEKYFDSGKHEYRVSAAMLSKGIYFLKMQSSGELIAGKKILVQ